MNPSTSLHRIRALGSGFKRSEYELYGLANRSPEECARFMSHRQLYRLYRKQINQGGQKHILEDKWLAHFIFTGLKIPTAETIGLYHPTLGRLIGGSPLTCKEHFKSLAPIGQEVDWIFKPRGGRQGKQIHRFHGKVDDLQKFLDSIGHPDVGGFYGTNYDGWIVQQRLQQHPTLNAINSSCINSLRIVTFHDRTGTISVDFSVLRVGRSGSSADNWDKGGISVYVDPDTGIMGPGVLKPKFGGEWCSRHPDSGVEFSGQAVPHWKQCLDLCREAATNLSSIPSIGWDIAITTESPRIMEGNADWDLPMVQVHSNGYLSDTVRKRLEPYGLSFPTSLKDLPSATLSVLLTELRRSRIGRWAGA